MPAPAPYTGDSSRESREGSPLHPGCVLGVSGVGGSGRERLLILFSSAVTQDSSKITYFVLSVKNHKNKLYFLIFCFLNITFLCGKQYWLLCSYFPPKYLDAILIVCEVCAKDSPKSKKPNSNGLSTLIPPAYFYSNCFALKFPSASQGLRLTPVCAPSC